MSSVNQKKAVQPTRKAVKVRGITPVHFSRRTVEDIEIGAAAWVSLDGKVALPARVIEKDERHYTVRFECRAPSCGV